MVDDRGGRPWWTTVVDDRGGRPCLRLGHSQVDRYLDFVSARARPNTTLAADCDLKVSSSVVAKEPVEGDDVGRIGLHHHAARRPRCGPLGRR